MFKNKNNFQTSEEESKEINQKINSHQGILFLIYIFGLLFFINASNLVKSKIKLGSSWVKLFEDNPLLQYVLLYFIFFYVIDFSSKIYDQKQSLDLLHRVKYTTIIYTLYILLFTQMNQIFTSIVFIFLIILIIFNYIMNHLNDLENQKKNITYKNKKRKLLIHQINYGLCLIIITLMVVGALINYVQKKFNITN